jgi:predicted Fe-Mo cluster-binding NifX family protein
MMKIALPVTDDHQFSAHYGGASRIALFEVDLELRQVLRQSIVTPPAPEPCGWPDWLHAQGVQIFLAGGMGGGPRQRLAALGVDVIVGVTPADPAHLVEALLQDRLATGANACGSGHGGHHHAHGHAHGSDRHEGHCHCAE